MFDLPTPIVLGLVGIVAIALFIFFWGAVRDLSLPFKIAARLLLTVLLILPLGLATFTWHTTQHTKQAGPQPGISSPGAPVLSDTGGNNRRSSANENQ